MAKHNEKSFCHDCGKKTTGENYYCDSCLEKNGLKKFNVIAFIIALLQPFAGVFIYMFTRDNLHPGINKAAKYALYVYLVGIIASAVFQAWASVLGYI